MSVRAKLYVSSVQRQAGQPDAVKVTLSAVTRGEENRAWAEATPQASFEMTIQNPDAAVQFVLGQEFHVTFDPTGAPSSLADGHDYEPGDYEAQQIEKQGLEDWLQAVNNQHHRCQACGAKRSSHDEPTRSKLIEWRP